jgi:putative salt-induced outer membrane protein
MLPRNGTFLVLVAGLACAMPAYAELPQPVRQMMEAAARDGNAAELAAVVKFARLTYPAESVEIDNLLLALESNRTQQAAAVPATSAPPAPPPTSPAAVSAAPAAPSPAALIKWSGRGDLGGFHTSGNTDSFGITGGAVIRRSEPSWSHQIRLRGDYQESEGRTSREYLNAAYQTDWTISEQHYALGILEYERDVLAGLDHRGTSSLGLGWRVVRDPDVAISLEAGPAFRHDWTRAGVERSNFAARGALTSSWQMNDKVKLSHNMELVAEDNSNTIRAVTGLQAKLTGRISSQISYDLRYQDRPLFGKEETDTVTRIGLTYDF